MASTVKVAIAANYLAQVEHAAARSTTGSMADRRQLMDAMIVHSDNHATDLLLGTSAGQ
jgi:beta-lactamase class A